MCAGGVAAAGFGVVDAMGAAGAELAPAPETFGTKTPICYAFSTASFGIVKTSSSLMMSGDPRSARYAALWRFQISM